MLRTGISLRTVLRSLYRAPGFTAAAVLTLAFGLGAATAVFSLVDGVLLEQLPYEDSNRILAFWGDGSWSQAELDFLREEAQSYESVGAFIAADAVYSGGSEPRVVDIGIVSPDLLDVLKITPQNGRLFSIEEETPGRGNVVVISDGFWKRELGSAPDVLGKTIELSEELHEIIGVMPPDTRFPTSTTELWVPLTINRESRGYRGSFYLTVLGRLHPDLTVGAAQRELDVLVPRLQEALDLRPGFDKLASTPKVETYLSLLTGEARTPLLLLAAASFLLLLVACANVAHLMIARAARRARDLAIRRAVGASARQLFVQLFVEASVIAAGAGVVGILIADRTLELLKGRVPPGTPRLEALGIDLAAFGLGLGVTVITVLVFSLLPVVRAGSVDLRSALGAGRGQSAGPSRLRWAIVASEMALAAWLATMAVSTGRSVIALVTTDVGFAREHVVTFRPELSGDTWSDPAMRDTFYNRIFERIGSMPDVESVGANWRLPIAETGAYQLLEVEGQPAVAGDDSLTIYWRAIAGDYFSAMKVPLIEGRAFDNRDARESLQVGIINRATAARFWPGESALGKRIRNSIDGDRWITVVGVVGDVRHEGVATDIGHTLYRPLAQSQSWIRSLSVVVSGRGSVERLLASVCDVVRQEAPGVPFSREATMSQVVARSVARETLTGVTVALYGTLAVALALLGVIGLLSYSISDRRRELGIRVALGAERGRIVWLVVRQGMKPAIAGAAIGVAISFAAERWLASVLYGVDANDPWSHLGVLGMLVAAALLACVVPAWGAAGPEATAILRDE